MGLPSFSGPARFAEVWRAAIETNGYIVERITSMECDETHEQPFTVRSASTSIDCLGIVGQRKNNGWQMEDCLYSVVVMPGNLLVPEQQNLILNICNILAATGARTTLSNNSGKSLFRVFCSKDQLFHSLFNELARNDLLLHMTDDSVGTGIVATTVNSKRDERRIIAHIVIGKTIDLATEKPCAFFGIRPPSLIHRFSNLFHGERYSRVVELCIQFSLSRVNNK